MSRAAVFSFRFQLKAGQLPLGIAWGIFRGFATIIFSIIAVFLLLAALAGEWSKAPEKPTRLGFGGAESERSEIQG